MVLAPISPSLAIVLAGMSMVFCSLAILDECVVRSWWQPHSSFASVIGVIRDSAAASTEMRRATGRRQRRSIQLSAETRQANTKPSNAVGHETTTHDDRSNLPVMAARASFVQQKLNATLYAKLQLVLQAARRPPAVPGGAHPSSNNRTGTLRYDVDQRQ